MTATDLDGGCELLRPGRVVAGAYRVVRRLGEGSTGTVAVAHELSLEREVALKVLRPELRQRLADNRRFRREARLLSRLAHPNVVTVHAFGVTEEGLPYLVMEYVRGRTLQRLADAEGTLDPELLSHVLVQIANGLAEAHQHGIVHRDLKPGNVLVGPVAGDPHFARVADLGLARLVAGDGAEGEPADEPLTRTGTVVGTPPYLSPEQARGAPVDARSDVYALGVLAVRLLTGKLPYEAGSSVEMMTAHLRDMPAMPSQLRPELGFEPGGAVDAAVGRALAKQPEARWPDARAFAAALAEGLQGGAEPERPEPTPIASSGGEAGAETRTSREAMPAGREAMPAGREAMPAGREAMPAGGADWLALLAREPGSTAARPRRVAVLCVELDASEGREAGATDPEEHAESLGVVAARLRRAIRGRSGRLLEPLADRQMAFFGPDRVERSAVEAAVDAGLAAREALREVRHDPTVPEAVLPAFRIGVDVGLVVGVAAGSEDTVVAGEAVFGARASAEAAGDGAFRLTRRAWRLVRGLFETDPDGGAEGARRVTGRRPPGRRAHETTFHGVPVELVGRDAELRQLERLRGETLGAGRAGGVLVSGPPGVGKSRLVRELLERTEEADRSIWIDAGRCGSRDDGQPYRPFVEALRSRTRVTDDDGPEEVELAAESFVQRFAAEDPMALDAEERALVELLRTLLAPDGASPEDAPGVEETVRGDEARRGALFERFAGLYRRLAARRPVVLFLDDFQWADEATRSLLGYLLGRLEEHPFLVVVVTRDEELSGSSSALARELSRVERLPVGPLSAEETERMTRHALRRLEEVPARLVRAVVELSGGVPLIVEETLHDLVDEGAVRVGGERWELDLTTLRRMRLPETAEQLFEGRARRLPASLYEALEVAAIAEEGVAPELVEAVTERGDGASALAELERRGFLVPAADAPVGGEHAWHVAQPAIRETVQRLVPAARRRALHRAVGEWLERRLQGGSAELSVALARHFDEADEPVRAFAHHRRAARRAQRVYALSEAIDELEACHRLLPRVPGDTLEGREREVVRLEIVADLVRLAALAGELHRAASVAEEALPEPTELPPRHRGLGIEVALQRGRALMQLGRYDDALRTHRACEAALDDDAPPGLRLRVATGEAAVRTKLGEEDEAARRVREALAAHEPTSSGEADDAATEPPVGRPDGPAGAFAAEPASALHPSAAHRTLGNAELLAGRLDAARRAYDRAYDLALAAHAPEAVVDALNGVAALAHFRDDPAAAEASWRRALGYADRYDLLQHRMVLLNNLGETLRGDDARIEEAVGLLQRAEALARFLGSDEALAETRRGLAAALLHLDRVEEAARAARDALDAAQRVGAALLLADAHRLRARALHNGAEDLAASERREAVAAHLDASVAAWERTGDASELEATRALREQLVGPSR